MQAVKEKEEVVGAVAVAVGLTGAGRGDGLLREIAHGWALATAVCEGEKDDLVVCALPSACACLSGGEKKLLNRIRG